MVYIWFVKFAICNGEGAARQECARASERCGPANEFSLSGERHVHVGFQHATGIAFLLEHIPQRGLAKRASNVRNEKTLSTRSVSSVPSIEYSLMYNSTFSLCVFRSSPEVKRSICKRCSGLLVPGATATHSFVSAGQPRVEVRCRNCGFVRRYLMPRSASPVPVDKHGAQAAAVSQQAAEQASILPASVGSAVAAASVTAATVEATAAASERETESMVDSR
jgi:RNase P subunit RPR2